MSLSRAYLQEQLGVPEARHAPYARRPHDVALLRLATAVDEVSDCCPAAHSRYRQLPDRLNRAFYCA